MTRDAEIERAALAMRPFLMGGREGDEEGPMRLCRRNARVALSAAYPEVTTVEEMAALPRNTWLVGWSRHPDGRAVIGHLEPRPDLPHVVGIFWHRVPGLHYAAALAAYGPLTVVRLGDTNDPPPL